MSWWERAPCCSDAVRHFPSAPIIKALLGDDAGERAPEIRTKLLWPNGSTLKYSCMMLHEESEEAFWVKVKKVINAVEEWERLVNLKFVYQEKPLDADICITFSSSGACWSYIGQEATKVPGGTPTMNIGFLTDKPTNDEMEHAIIVHEFGHALGLIHEHSLNGKVFIADDAAYEFYRETQGWDSKQVFEQILSVYNKGEKGEVTNYLKADPESIMNLFMAQELNAAGTAVEPILQLSANDRAFMSVLYPRFGNPEDEARFLRSLSWFGFDKELEYFREWFAAQAWDDIRLQFFRLVLARRLGWPPPEPKPSEPKPSEGDEPVEPIKEFWLSSNHCLEAIRDFDAARLRKSDRDVDLTVKERYDNLWPMGVTLNWTILTDRNTTTQIISFQKAKIDKVLTSLMSKAKVKFAYVSNSKAATIRISLDPQHGNWSYCGKEISTIVTEEPTMNLGTLTQNQDSKENSLILHQFLHVLGLIHEHDPGNGDAVLDRKATNAIYRATQGWQSRDIDAN